MRCLRVTKRVTTDIISHDYSGFFVSATQIQLGLLRMTENSSAGCNRGSLMWNDAR